jgi:hypothetical protein
MDDILENPHVARNAPVFSRREYAEVFLFDGVRIAAADREIHPDELKWLKRIAEANGLPALWVEEEAKKIAEKNPGVEPERMEIEVYL